MATDSQELIKEVVENAIVSNKYVTNDFLRGVSTLGKLKYTDPRKRDDYALRCKKMGLITEKEYQDLIKP